MSKTASPTVTPELLDAAISKIIGDFDKNKKTGREPVGVIPGVELQVSNGMPAFHGGGGTMSVGDFSCTWSTAITGGCLYVFPEDKGDDKNVMYCVPMRPILEAICDLLMTRHGYNDQGKKAKAKKSKAKKK